VTTVQPQQTANARRRLARAGYHLQDLEAYATELRAAGFTVSSVRDNTALFAQSLREEHAHLLNDREDFLRRFGEDGDLYLDERWRAKIAFCDDGDLQ
jgi:hypothetical protein